METMPYRPETEAVVVTAALALESSGAAWRAGLPVLRTTGLTLRELRVSDAPALWAFLTSEDVTRFISPPPATIEGFEQFIAWTHAKRAAGQYVGIGIVPDGYDVPVGLFQIQIRPGQQGEWGFALGCRFWGSGLFLEAATAVRDFAFDQMGLECLGARAAVGNRRGNAALRKLGAVRNHLIPNGLMRHGRLLDQYLWTVTPADRPGRATSWN